jgi:hypothetical protein
MGIEIKAGWSKREITPAEPVFMGGYGFRTHRSCGVYMPLRVGAVSLRSDAGEICLVPLDLVSVQKEDAEIFLARLAAEAGIERDAVVLLPSHTHTAPLLHENWSNFELNQIGEPERRLRGQFADAIVQCVKEARQSAEPARVEIAFGRSDVGINRRGPNGERMPNPAGVTDPIVSALILTKSGQETSPCVVFAYGCHPTTRAGYLIGPDFPGPARLYLEEKHPGLVSFFVQGFEGDVRPASFDQHNRWLNHENFIDAVAHFGQKLGREVDRIYEQEPRIALSGPIRSKQISIDLPLELDHLERRLAEAEAEEKPFHRKWAGRMRQALRANEPLQQSVPMVMHGFTVGNDFGFLGLGGEICSGYAHGFRALLPEKHLMFSALADDNAASYIPTDQILREGGYEAEIFRVTGRPGPYTLGLEATVYEAGGAMLRDLWRNR